jgi:hypothetical protein
MRPVNSVMEPLGVRVLTFCSTLAHRRHRHRRACLRLNRPRSASPDRACQAIPFGMVVGALGYVHNMLSVGERLTTRWRLA